MTLPNSKAGRAPRGVLPPRRNLVFAAGALSGVLLGAFVLTLFPTRRPPPPASVALAKSSAPVAVGDGAPSAARATAASGPDAPRIPHRPPPQLEILTTRYDWLREPVAPTEIDERRFTEALAQLCNVATDSQVRTWYAGFIVKYARRFGTDAFLLGGLMAARSRCDPARPSPGVGLTGLLPELYEPEVQDGRYRYRAFLDDGWQTRTLVVDSFPFTRAFLNAPESNLYFAAAFLKAQEERQRGLFASFRHGVEYRHYVSHFVWGDVVQSNRQEDQILVERRRLLEYYGAKPPAAPVSFRGVTMGCPLDGCPRVITSTLGDSRAGGTRVHRGVDFESTEGEPVRAVADGKVIFSGADLPGSAHQGMPIYAQRSVAGSLFGAGGIYVCIAHGLARDKPAAISCYMHLQASVVDQGRMVKRGDQIGRVGKTGIKHSGPHLHFEVHADDKVVAATEALPGLVLGTPRNTPLPNE